MNRICHRTYTLDINKSLLDIKMGPPVHRWHSVSYFPYTIYHSKYLIVKFIFMKLNLKMIRDMASSILAVIVSLSGT